MTDWPPLHIPTLLPPPPKKKKKKKKEQRKKKGPAIAALFEFLYFVLSSLWL